MNYWFLLKCFLVGISVASAVGPIFVLTFNRGAIYGFLKGFYTALGSALGDGFLFFLGSIGILNFFGTQRIFLLSIDLIGGLILILAGIKLIRGNGGTLTNDKMPTECPGTIPTILKAFIVTILNPLALLFFMFVSLQLIPVSMDHLPISHIIAGSILITSGSLSILSLVAFAASRVRHAMKMNNLHVISYITGAVIVCIGGYFLFDFVRLLLRIK